MTHFFDPRANKRPSRATILTSATVAVVVMLALVYLAAVAPRAVPLLPYYYVNAQFKNAENLRLLNTVQIAGRRVGQVSNITYHDGLAVVELQMLPGTQNLTVTLKAGTYDLFCSVPGHKALGMDTHITVGSGGGSAGGGTSTSGGGGSSSSGGGWS